MVNNVKVSGNQTCINSFVHCLHSQRTEKVFKPPFYPSFRHSRTSKTEAKQNKAINKCNSTQLTTRTDPSPVTTLVQEASRVILPSLSFRKLTYQALSCPPTLRTDPSPVTTLGQEASPVILLSLSLTKLTYQVLSCKSIELATIADTITPIPFDVKNYVAETLQHGDGVEENGSCRLGNRGFE